MFNRTYVMGGGRTEYVTKEINVTEKRAPTDESVALLSEMEEAARSKLFDAFVIEDNTVNMSAVVFRDMEFNGLIVRYKLKINGKTMDGKCSFKDSSSYDRMVVFRSALRDLVEAAIDQVASDMAPAFLSVMR